MRIACMNLLEMKFPDLLMFFKGINVRHKKLVVSVCCGVSPIRKI